MSRHEVVEESGEVVAALEPDERAALEAAGVEPAVVSRKDCSYRTLLDAGVDESVAGELRRRFSLSWSFEADGDLDRRSAEVSGLGEAEREWVERSADEDWQAFDPSESTGTTETAVDDGAERERPWPRPTPVTAVTGVGPEDAARLAEAGIVSAERLATAPAREVATALDLNVLHVRTWRYNARDLVD